MVRRGEGEHGAGGVVVEALVVKDRGHTQTGTETDARGFPMKLLHMPVATVRFHGGSAVGYGGAPMKVLKIGLLVAEHRAVDSNKSP